MKKQKLKNLMSVNQLENNENSVVNQIHCEGLNPEEWVEKYKDVEMEEVTTKPLNKLWFEVSNKIKFLKPKKTESTFIYISNELEEIYGFKVGNIMTNFLLDVVEGEFYKLNNGEFLPFIDLLEVCSQNKWKKVIDRVSSLLKTEGLLMIG